jgi:hypothetical protein
MSGPPFYGKYRGAVTDNRDPWNMARIRAKVPDVLGENESGWAMPSVPYAGNGVGMFFIPPIKSSVWIEFENGDPDYPIWTGCFWSQEEVPAEFASPEMKVIKTDVGTITLNDNPGSGILAIETISGMKISISPSGIEINDGQGGSIKLSGPRISLNDDALEVI